MTSLTAMQQFLRSWGHSGHDTSTVARRGPPRASPSTGRRTHPEIGQKLHRPAKGGNGEASAKSRRVNQFSVFVFGLPHSPAPREGFWKGFNFSLSFFCSTRVDNADATASLARVEVTRVVHGGTLFTSLVIFLGSAPCGALPSSRPQTSNAVRVERQSRMAAPSAATRRACP